MIKLLLGLAILMDFSGIWLMSYGDHYEMLLAAVLWLCAGTIALVAWFTIK